MTRPPRVAFQGEPGAYSEEAALTLFGDAPTLPVPALADAFASVEEGRADAAVVPIENSHAGSINQTYDLLLRSRLVVRGELRLPIRHMLLALPGERLETIREVYSHPQALAQCAEFLAARGLRPMPAHDTAGAARMIAEERRRDAAAIAGARAAALYGLAVLARNVESSEWNATRFIVLGREPAARAGASKTSIVFATADAPGALYRALGAFATRGVNLVKLESRPSRARPWEYVFYLDFDGHRDDPEPAAALADLERHAAFVRVLGSYPRAG